MQVLMTVSKQSQDEMQVFDDRFQAESGWN
jgi:hypothetical protein